MKDTNLIIGKRNTGKTRNILFKQTNYSINNNENILFYDDRDEYYKTFKKKLEEKNYNIITLNLEDTTKSHGYNPLLLPYLLYKENNLDKAIGMVNDLALEIFKTDNLNSDPFWENMASNYFTGLVLILFNEANESEINIGSIQVLMNQGELEIDDTTYLKKYLENIDITNTIYSLLSPTVYAPLDTRGSIISVAKQKLNTYLLREQLLNLLNTSYINLKNITNKTAIFIIGSESIKDIANIFINQLVQTINIPFTFILDNFDSLRRVITFKSFINNASYFNHKVYVSIHNEDEFKEKYGNYITDNFDDIIYLNKDDKMPKENLEDIGTYSDYPILKMNKHDYFNFKDFMENKFK